MLTIDVYEILVSDESLKKTRDILPCEFLLSKREQYVYK